MTLTDKEAFKKGFEKSAKIYKSLGQALNARNCVKGEPMKLLTGPEFVSKIQVALAERRAAREIGQLRASGKIKFPLPSAIDYE